MVNEGASAAVSEVIGAEIHYSGIVQGVGFRPTVYKYVHRYNLKGTVQNTVSGVFLKVDGKKKDIETFYRYIKENPPVHAEIQKSTLSFRQPFGFTEFTIIESTESREGFTDISPDIATCEDCLKDMKNPADRRFRYPFINCTNCGPRFTIVRSVPYDRKNTTMSIFPMCQDCRVEYEDPSDRRYHAQPDACPVCGPEIALELANRALVEGDPFANTIEFLKQGKIIAIKGLGGYHFAVDPLNDMAVRRLRKRKKRKGKPFALMARNLQVARRYGTIGENDAKLLLSPPRPIVLLQRGPEAYRLSGEISPDTDTIGIMLPYTPVHHILMAEGPEILVMTSANLSEEPLVFTDTDAYQSLASIADAFLSHNRDIVRPCDDSVVMSLGRVSVPVRRSRGYVPRPISLERFSCQILAAGASEKNTFCVFKDGKAYMSHHIGDLNNEKSADAYVYGIEDFLKIFRVHPRAVAADVHPDYLSTRYAQEYANEHNVQLFSIQHHHAHIASVLAEQRYEGKVIGLAFDGTGYGPDGTIWGGEFLIADKKEFRRVAHFAPVDMPGGEMSIVETDRMALSYLLSTYGSLSGIPSFRFIDDFEPGRASILEKIIAKARVERAFRIKCPLTSSCGRLFDAVSSLMGLCKKPAYDAQGAILLEREAKGLKQPVRTYSYSVDGEKMLNFASMIGEIVDDIRSGVPNRIIAQRFHSTIVHSGIEMCRIIRKSTGIDMVALSGGVFQNRIILRSFVSLLKKNNFSVLINSLVPPNDGGISLGQGLVALKSMEGGHP